MYGILPRTQPDHSDHLPACVHHPSIDNVVDACHPRSPLPEHSASPETFTRDTDLMTVSANLSIIQEFEAWKSSGGVDLFDAYLRGLSDEDCRAQLSDAGCDTVAVSDGNDFSDPSSSVVWQLPGSSAGFGVPHLSQYADGPTEQFTPHNMDYIPANADLPVVHEALIPGDSLDVSSPDMDLTFATAECGFVQDAGVLTPSGYWDSVNNLQCLSNEEYLSQLENLMCDMTMSDAGGSNNFGGSSSSELSPSLAVSSGVPPLSNIPGTEYPNGFIEALVGSLEIPNIEMYLFSTPANPFIDEDFGTQTSSSDVGLFSASEPSSNLPYHSSWFEVPANNTQTRDRAESDPDRLSRQPTMAVELTDVDYQPLSLAGEWEHHKSHASATRPDGNTFLGSFRLAEPRDVCTPSIVTDEQANRAGTSGSESVADESTEEGEYERTTPPVLPTSSNTKRKSSSLRDILPKQGLNVKLGAPFMKNGRRVVRCPVVGCTHLCRTGDLSRHLSTLVHRDRSFLCTRCGRNYTREDALKRHQAKVKHVQVCYLPFPRVSAISSSVHIIKPVSRFGGRARRRAARGRSGQRLRVACKVFSTRASTCGAIRGLTRRPRCSPDDHGLLSSADRAPSPEVTIIRLDRGVSGESNVVGLGSPPPVGDWLAQSQASPPLRIVPTPASIPRVRIRDHNSVARCHQRSYCGATNLTAVPPTALVSSRVPAIDQVERFLSVLCVLVIRCLHAFIDLRAVVWPSIHVSTQELSSGSIYVGEQPTITLPSFPDLKDSLDLPPPGPPHTLFTDTMSSTLRRSPPANQHAKAAKQHARAAHVAASIISPLPQCRPGHCLASTGPPGQWYGLHRHALRIVEVVQYPGGARSKRPIPLCVQPFKHKDWRPTMWLAYICDAEVEKLANPRLGDAPPMLELSVQVRSVVLGDGRPVIVQFDAQPMRQDVQLAMTEWVTRPRRDRWSCQPSTSTRKR
ncbi:hypothetical protein BV25DRAFT_1983692 [Artomyces pyxidatus]|uniref:Uncharacterized protein n=1 Tax=Artomyces pyxidatus TaxID=48021 RepID=A0ACB8SH16_9AGAM|nr:hypothetical protein BV25DRAFT_1983692 [Artomyces pyxidatus]